MKWYTCIVHVPWHVSPVQVFHTRAETVEAAVKHAEAWLAEPNHDAPNVEFVFEGKLEYLPMGDEVTPAPSKGE